MVRSVISTDKTVKETEEKILTIHVQPGLPQGIKFCFPEAGDQNPTIIPGLEAWCTLSKIYFKLLSVILKYS